MWRRSSRTIWYRPADSSSGMGGWAPAPWIPICASMTADVSAGTRLAGVYLRCTRPILKVVEKVVAYIMSGSRLLVFRHVDLPEARVQAPAGTVDPGEAPDDAVLWEAQEETGL